jgi:hypothetical protein
LRSIGTQAAAQGQSILPQGTFEQLGINGKPAGWQIQSPETTILAGDAKNHWVQLRDGAVMMHFLRLSPEWNKLVISARFKKAFAADTAAQSTAVADAAWPSSAKVLWGNEPGADAKL